MINLADKLTAKTVEGILADSNEIKYTKEMGDTAKAETVAKELSNITDSMSGLSNSVTALSQEFETTQSDIEQLLNKAEQYTDRFVDNPIANSENSGLMSADDKKKADNYPERFVMDFGLVESQAVGEQMAAASEVAGNRNISFIRFQVQGVEALKTTLIMQWPNGINETAQIMCVDKAQWRRNVTGATGVEGAPTNAYPWECTAPHYIFYDAARRIIQLQNYEKKDVKSVELPLATSTQDGLLSAADKTKLENYPETPLNISTATDDSPGLMSEVAYKDLYDTKTLAAGNQTKITDLEAKINELGNFDTQHQLLARAAEFDIVSNNSIVFIHGTYKQAEGIYHGVFILQQVEMNNNGGGTSMQYIYIEKRQYTRYISFSPTEVTEVQQVQNHGVRNLSLSGRNLQMTDVWGYNVGIGVTFPDNGNIYEGTPSMSSVPVVLAKTFGGTVATTLSAATSTRAGMMSAADKTKLDKTKPVEEVTWTEQSHMNAYTECGEFHIKGERTNANDGLPILNAASGHTIDATLTVLDSSLSGGTGAKTDACVTQVLRMSNRTGGDGHIYVRTGQGVDKEQLDWGTWEKLMGMFEKNGIDTLEDLDGYTTNGIYSGLYAGTEPKNFYLVRFLPGDTFLMIIVNGYAASPFGTPQITQLLYKLPAKTSTSEQNAEIYLRTGSYNKTDKVWVWGNFKRMATNDELSFQVATLTAKINQNAANIASANEAASEAITTAQEVKTAAETVKSELNGKQDALTLTVKDNGNIVLANIQGQSKEFMPATPSGDQMHYAYVTAGAEYNDTGADIVKDAPWADMIDDDYTGEYGKTVVHKAGHWYLNGLGDITNDEIREIYYTSGNIILNYGSKYDYFSPYYNIRTMFTLNMGGLNWTGNLKIESTQFCHSMRKCIVYNAFHGNNNGIILEQGTMNNIFNGAVKLIHSLTPITLKSKIDNNYGLLSCSSIVTIKIKGVGDNLIIAKTPVLSMKSVLYMINNEAATSPITITLHADVYNKCMANENISAALAAHTNISLASA